MSLSYFTRKHKGFIALLFFLIIIVLGNFVLRPYVSQRNAFKVIQSVLEYWEKGDMASPIEIWLTPEKYPAFDNISSFEIVGSDFKQVNNIDYALFLVNLEFPRPSGLPSWKNWTFELKRTKYGWRVMRFYLSAKHPAKK